MTTQTQVLPQRKQGLAWFEHESAAGSPIQTPINTFPFTIGRDESADLQVDSSRVSRHHVAIEREGKRFRVKDLKSTNGTFLNGERIEEALLGDGDILLVADRELTFFCGGGQQSRKTVTQVMGGADTSPDDEARLDLVREVRQLHEILLQRSVRVLFESVVDLSGGPVFGYRVIEPAIGSRLVSQGFEHHATATPSRLNVRMHRLYALLAVEQASQFPGEAHLLMALENGDLGTDSLKDHLEQLRDVMTGNRRLVVEIPHNTITDRTSTREFLVWLKERGFGVAIDGVVGGGRQDLRHKEGGPDYVKLARSMIQGMEQSSNRRRQVEAAIQAYQEIGAKIIATGLRSAEEPELCRELGCQYAQGELYGAAQPCSALVPGPTSLSGNHHENNGAEHGSVGPSGGRLAAQAVGRSGPRKR